MRILILFFASLLASAEALPGLVDIAKSPAWLDGVSGGSTAVDSQGNVYFAGLLQEGLTPPGAKVFGTRGRSDIFVAKMDSTLQQIAYVVVLGGNSYRSPAAIGVNAAGEVFVAGNSDLAGFLLRLNAAGDDVAYLFQGAMSVTSLAVDGPRGVVYLGGIVQGGKLTGTSGAYQPQPSTGGNQAYVIKVDTASGSPVFGTYLNGQELTSLVMRADGSVAFLARDRIGALNLSGSALEFEKALPSFAYSMTGGDGFLYVLQSSTELTKYSPAGDVVRRINFPAGTFGPVLTVAPDGTIFMASVMGESYSKTRNALEACATNTMAPRGLAGITPSSDFSNTGGLTIFSSDGTVKYASRTTMQLASAVVSGSYLYGVATEVLYQTGDPPTGVQTTRSRLVVRLDLRQVPVTDRPAPACIVQGASYRPGGASPGEIMTIYGSGLGPATGTSFQLRDGRVPSDLAGTSVTVDGKPAPVLYVQDEQINFMIPWQTRSDGVVNVCVMRSSERSCLPVSATAMSPGIFGNMISLQDGRVNSFANPVAPGGYVSLYLTGLGAMDSALADGSISGIPLQRVVGRVQARLVYSVSCSACAPIPPLEVSYAGSAPTLVSGVQQVNVHIPPERPSAPVILVLDFPDSPIKNIGLFLYMGGPQ